MGGFNLHRVFAVLFFLLVMFSCTNASNNSKRVLPIYSTFKNSAIYTAAGDFDGDGKMESIFITKPDENYYISILDNDNIIYKKLNYKADNLKLTIQDINNDNREDIIINIIQNSTQNCYVYTVNTGINTLLSPDLIKANVDLKSIEDYIALECGYMNLPVTSNIEQDIRLYFTEMDYSEDRSVFVSEGSVFNKNITILNVQTTVSIDNNGKIILENIDVLPIKN